MKIFITGILFLLIGLLNPIWAQTKTVTPIRQTAQATARGNGISTPTHFFNLHLLDTFNVIARNQKSGKLTQGQAQALRIKVKAIRIQEFQFMKSNGNKQLTTDQISQLNQQVNELVSF